MLIESKIGELSFVHTRETFWKINHIGTSSLPDRDGGLMHQDASELFCGTGQMQNVEGTQMSKYLVALLRCCVIRDYGEDVPRTKYPMEVTSDPPICRPCPSPLPASLVLI